MDTIQRIGKYMLADGYDMVVDLEKSSGYKIYDKKHDKTYLDFFSFFASAPIGFNHPKMTSDDEFLKNLQMWFPLCKVPGCRSLNETILIRIQTVVCKKHFYYTTSFYNLLYLHS